MRYIVYLICLLVLSVGFHAHADEISQERCSTLIEIEQFSNPTVMDGYIMLESENSSTFLLWRLGEIEITNPEFNPDDIVSISVLPFSIGRNLNADTIREPKLSPNNNRIAYSAVYSQRHLNRSVHFVWSLTERQMVGVFPWMNHWIHFIDWYDNDTMAFLTQQNDALSIDLVNIAGQIVRVIPLDNLDFTIDTTPWATLPFNDFFFLWTTLSHAHNLVLWHRTSGDTETELSHHRMFNIDTFEDFSVFDDSEAFLPLAPGIHQRRPAYPPVWSHQGEVFAMTLPERSSLTSTSNLHLFSVNDGFQQITFFEPNDQMDSFEVINTAWSHDDRFIAFLLINSNEGRTNGSDLYLYDVEGQILVNLPFNLQRPSNIVWANHGYYLAFVDTDFESEVQRQLTITDLDACEFTRLDENEIGVDPAEVYRWFTLGN